MRAVAPSRLERWQRRIGSLSAATGIGLWFGLAFLVLAFNAAVSHWSLAGFVQSTDRAAVLQEVRVEMEELLAGLRGAESAQRRFLIGQDPDALDVFEEQLDKAHLGLQQLGAHGFYETDDLALLPELESLVRRREERLREGVRMRLAGTLALEDWLERSAYGEQLMTEIEALLAGVARRPGIEPVRSAADARGRAARNAIAIGNASAMVLLGLAFLLIRRTLADRERTQEALAQNAAKLAASNAELEQFAYVASHDLQEPLRMVAMYTELLAEQQRDRLDDASRDYVAFTLDGVQRMQSLINDLLEYSRAGADPDEVEPTDCNILLRRTLLELQLAIESSHATITYDRLPVVPAVAFQLGRVFQNLIMNAIKFHGEEPPHIHVSAERRDDEWILAFRDNGIGIHPAYSDRIFDMFQRLHPRSRFGGTGIGLAICKKVIERHGGRIWVHSAPGAGSTFFCALPATGP